jgi:hypothetical protein
MVVMMVMMVSLYCVRLSSEEVMASRDELVLAGAGGGFLGLPSCACGCGVVRLKVIGAMWARGDGGVLSMPFDAADDPPPPALRRGDDGRWKLSEWPWCR